MGTINFTVGRYARSRGSGAATLMGTNVVTSDAYTTTTAAAYIEDGSGDISLVPGDVFRCSIDEAAWIRFHGDAATVGDGFALIANQEYEWEATESGKVSVIDVA